MRHQSFIATRGLDELLRQQCEDPQRRAAAAFDLHRNRKNRRAFRGKVLQGATFSKIGTLAAPRIWWAAKSREGP